MEIQHSEIKPGWGYLYGELSVESKATFILWYLKRPNLVWKLVQCWDDSATEFPLILFFFSIQASRTHWQQDHMGCAHEGYVVLSGVLLQWSSSRQLRQLIGKERGAWWRHTRELIKDSKRVRQPQEKVQRSMIICGFWTPGSSPGSEQKTITYWPQHLAARNTVLQPTGEIFQTFSDFCSCSVSQVTSPFLTFYFYYTLKHYRRMKKI